MSDHDETHVSQGDLRLLLRAELAEFKNELFEKLVTKGEHTALAQIVAGNRRDIDRNIGWRNKIAGAIALLVVFASFATPVVIQHYVH